MEVFNFLLIFFGYIVVPCSAIVYTPCEFARRLRVKFNGETPKFLTDNVSLVVCIAGYHNYDTSEELVVSLLSNRACQADRGYMNSCSMEVLRCLYETALNGNSRAAYMYERLCGPDLTQRFVCEGTDRFDVGDVWVPIYKDIFNLTFGDELAVIEYLSARKIEYTYNGPSRESGKAIDSSTCSAVITDFTPPLPPSHSLSTIIISTIIVLLFMVGCILTYCAALNFVKWRPVRLRAHEGFVQVPQRSA